ncbi:MAG: FGGY-family carbohydrate kinase [Acidimicrobiales bacterium]
MPTGGKCLIGIDLGNTAVKVAAFGSDGALIRLARRPTPSARTQRLVVRGHDLGTMLSAEHLWSLVRECLDELASRSVGPPGAMAVTGMGGPLVALDQLARPVYPVIGGIGGAIPSKAVPSDPDEHFRITGYVIGTTILGQLGWLAEHDPERFGAVSSVLTVEDYVAFRLTGEKASEPSTAAATGGWSHADRTWWPRAIEAAALTPGHLAPLAVPGKPLGELRSGPAGWRGALVAVGGHDYLCAAAALGVTDEGSCLDVLGTFEIISAPTQRLPPISAPSYELIVDVHVVPELRSFMVQLLAGAQLDAFAESFGGAGKHVALESDCAAMQRSDIEDLFFVPYVTATGSPGLARGPHPAAWIGAGPGHGPVHLYRAMLLGLACYSAHAVRELGREVGGLQRVVVTGGGAARQGWLQDKADTLGAAIQVADDMESTARGAALLSGVALGLYEDLDDAYLRTKPSLYEVSPSMDLSAYMERWSEAVSAVSGLADVLRS